MTEPTVPPISDEELAHVRRGMADTVDPVWAVSPKTVTRLIARIDLERERADAAEAECELLRAVVEAAKLMDRDWDQWMMGDDEPAPEQAILAIRNALAALAAPPDPKEGSE